MCRLCVLGFLVHFFWLFFCCCCLFWFGFAFLKIQVFLKLTGPLGIYFGYKPEHFQNMDLICWIMKKAALLSLFQHRMSDGDKKEGELWEQMRAHGSKFCVHT